MAIYFSQIYCPPARSQEEYLMRELEKKIPAAEERAWDAVTGDGKNITRHQSTFLLHQDAKSWGYCIEEQLDKAARLQGWGRQTRLDGARPDYVMRWDRIPVYVDLTTAGQSAYVGGHITAKLQRTGTPMGTAYGADIVYEGPSPLGNQHRLVQPTASESEKKAYGYYLYCKSDDGDYPGDRMGAVINKYANISSHVFFFQWNNAKRQEFEQAVSEALR